MLSGAGNFWNCKNAAVRNTRWYQKLRTTARAPQELLALADIVVVRDRNCPADMGIVGIVILPRYETLGGWPWAFGLGNLAVGIWLCTSSFGHSAVSICVWAFC